MRAERPTRIHTAAGRALPEYQRRQSYAYRNELVKFLHQEWNISMFQATVFRFFFFF